MDLYTHVGQSLDMAAPEGGVTLDKAVAINVYNYIFN